jgi:Xaa-Pro aminopeptidase
LEDHEAPYLRGGSDAVIATGHTFSNEPGVYIKGKIGIRLEDCFYINDSGVAVYLTEGVGGQASGPLYP